MRGGPQVIDPNQIEACRHCGQIFAGLLHAANHEIACTQGHRGRPMTHTGKRTKQPSTWTPWNSPRDQRDERSTYLVGFTAYTLGVVCFLYETTLTLVQQGFDAQIELRTFGEPLLLLAIGLFVMLLAKDTRQTRRIKALEDRLGLDGQAVTARDTAASRPTGSEGVN